MAKVTVAKTLTETVQCVTAALLSQPRLTLTVADLSACDYNPLAVELAVETLVKEGKAWAKGNLVGLVRRSEPVQQSLIIIPSPPGVVGERDADGLRKWCEEYGIERVTMSRDFERGEYRVSYDGTSDRFEVTTWKAGSSHNGEWRPGYTETIASFNCLSEALIELAYK